jgi:hypothetical protein
MKTFAEKLAQLKTIKGVSFRILRIISSELSEAFKFFRWMYHCYCFDPFLMMSKYPSANWIHFWPWIKNSVKLAQYYQS